MRWKPLFAVLLGLLMVRVTTGSAAAMPTHQGKQQFSYSEFVKDLNNQQNTLGRQFLTWYSEHSILLPPLNSITVQELFARFLRESKCTIVVVKDSSETGFSGRVQLFFNVKSSIHKICRNKFTDIPIYSHHKP